MLWKQEIKQLRRTPLRTLIFCLALCAIIGLINVTLGMKIAAERAVEEVEEQYTTVAVYKRISRQKFPTKEAYQQAKAAREEMRRQTTSKIKSIELEAVSDIDMHSWLQAYNDTLIPVTSEYLSEVAAVAELNRPGNVALFSVTCLEGNYQRETNTATPNGVVKNKVYTYRFCVNEAAVLHEDYTCPQELRIESAINVGAKDPIFEAGKTYWVWGYYDPINKDSGSLTIESSIAQTDRFETQRIVYFNYPSNYASYILPVVAEVDENRDISAYWDRLIENLDISTHTVNVVTADHVEGLLAFAGGYSHLIAGETFSEDDIVNNRKVVIVSNLLAERNGLTVGDEIDLSFYHAFMDGHPDAYHEDRQMYPARVYGQSRTDYDNLRQQDLPLPSTYDGTYTIVGIYSADAGIVDDYHTLHPNTVIIPTSILNGAHYSIALQELEVSFLLPNGGIEAFEAELASYGFGELLEYYDSGYSVIMPHVRSIQDSTVFANDVVLVLWVIVVLAVLILFVWMQIPAGRIKYRLGAGKGAIWREMAFTTVLTVLISGVIGGLGSIVLYDKALAYMMQSDFTSFNTAFSSGSANGEMLEQILTMLGQEPQFFVLVSAVQIGILSILGAVICAIVSLRKTGFGQ